MWFDLSLTFRVSDTLWRNNSNNHNSNLSILLEQEEDLRVVEEEEEEGEAHNNPIHPAEETWEPGSPRSSPIHLATHRREQFLCLIIIHISRMDHGHHRGRRSNLLSPIK